MMLDSNAIEQMEQNYRALFMNSLSGFKSANLVGTCNDEGKSNLAIVSSVVHLGAHPPLLAMVIRPHTVPRHTLENIQQTGYYTLNHIRQDIYQQAHQTSARYPQDISEFAATGLSEEWLDDFSAPFVAESRIKLGMKFREQHHLAINKTELVIGEVVHIEVPDEIICEDGYVALEKAGTVVISSLDSYHRTELLDHLTYAKPDKKPTKLQR